MRGPLERKGGGKAFHAWNSRSLGIWGFRRCDRCRMASVAWSLRPHIGLEARMKRGDQVRRAEGEDVRHRAKEQRLGTIGNLRHGGFGSRGMGGGEP